MAEEEEGHSPHIAMDWAPTEAFVEAAGVQVAQAEMENFSRSSAVRHMPIARAPPPEVIEQSNPLLVEGDPAVDVQKEDAKVLLLCMGIGFLLGVGIILTINYVRQ